MKGIINSFRGLCKGELFGTGAIIGGIVAQEVIKYITKQYNPIKKTVVYDGLACQLVELE